MEYGYFCEDTALELFIDKVLYLYKGVQLHKHTDFFNTIGLAVEGNDTTIDRKYEEVSKVAQLYRLNLFLVARDYDNKPIDQYQQFIDTKKDKLNIRIRNRTVFCVPVKCVEYWVYYVKHQNDENAPAPNSLETDETFNCHIAKADVYNGKLDNGKYVKQSRETEKMKQEEILLSLNINRLCGLSPSFAHFVSQLRAVNL